MSGTRLISVVAFLVGLAGLVVVEWRARRPESELPTIADMCGVVMRYRVGRLPVGRIAVFSFWWWVGWHFFAR